MFMVAIKVWLRMGWEDKYGKQKQLLLERPWSCSEAEPERGIPIMDYLENVTEKELLHWYRMSRNEAGFCSGLSIFCCSIKLAPLCGGSSMSQPTSSALLVYVMGRGVWRRKCKLSGEVALFETQAFQFKRCNWLVIFTSCWVESGHGIPSVAGPGKTNRNGLRFVEDGKWRISSLKDKKKEGGSPSTQN